MSTNSIGSTQDLLQKIEQDQSSEQSEKKQPNPTKTEQKDTIQSAKEDIDYKIKVVNYPVTYPTYLSHNHTLDLDCIQYRTLPDYCSK